MKRVLLLLTFSFPTLLMTACSEDKDTPSQAPASPPLQTTQHPTNDVKKSPTKTGPTLGKDRL